VLFAYRSGWRIGEIRNLQWKQVDRKQGIVTLYVGETKNKAARTLYLDDELRAMFESLWQARKASDRLLPWVFLNGHGTDKLEAFKKSWKTACKSAKVGDDRLVHDFRRTAVRNMVRAGIPERVAMQISGHRTRSVFDRYNIVSDADLKSAAQRHAAYLEEISGKNGIASTPASTLTIFPANDGKDQEVAKACNS
jgi:integrase